MPELNGRRVLFQEFYRDEPWRLLCCVIMLNQTSGSQLDKIHAQFFERWPHPLSLGSAICSEVEAMVAPLGLQRRRARSLIRMSLAYWFLWDGGDPTDLPGIGQYGKDSWDIFIRGRLDVRPQDKELRRYLEWMNSPR